MLFSVHLALTILSCNGVSERLSHSSFQHPILAAGTPVPEISIASLKQYEHLTDLDETLAPTKDDHTLSPYFQVMSAGVQPDIFPLKNTIVDVEISGVIADVHIQQEYTNHGPDTIEALYVFPMSTKAAVYGMTMTIGDRTIVADIKPKTEARKDYEVAKSNGQSASLLEQKRPNVFQMNVANVLPGDNITVDIHYTEILVPVEQSYSFVFPTVVGPRFESETAQHASTEQWVTNPYVTESSDSPSRVSIGVAINAPFPIQMLHSSSHAIETQYNSATEAFVDLEQAHQNRDFILDYKLAGQQVASGLMLFEGEDENFFLAMVEPPETLTTEDVLPREYIYLVDVSGSMRGFPLSVSKAIIGTMLQTLRPEDHFNIVFFAGGNQILSERSLPATSANIQRAQHWLSNQSGGGGTQLLSALRRSLELPKSQGLSRTIAVVTDGYVTVEKEAFALIKEKLGEANLFTYGIGTAVNRLVIEGMSRAGRGESFVVTSQEEALVEGARFANYILHPVLTDIQVSFDGVEVYDVSPLSQPDLFSSRPILIYGKYHKRSKNASISIRGNTASDDYEDVLYFEEAEQGADQSALVQLWARQKISELDDIQQFFPESTIEEEVTQLGLKYNLMTRYTSFVAIDSLKRSDGTHSTSTQPLVLPTGVSHAGLGGLGGAGSFASAGEGMKRSSAAIGAKGVHIGSGGLGAGTGAKGRGIGKSGSGSGSGGVQIGSVQNGEAIVLGALDKSMIDSVIKRNINQIRYCYQKELHKYPNLNGTIVVKFVVAADGSVQKSVIKSSTMGSEAAQNCVAKRLLRMKFPAPKGGGIAIVSYPFVFTP